MTEGSIVIIVVAVISAIPGTIAAGMGIVNGSRLKDIHISINSRMDELLRYGKAEAKELGRAEGVDTERQRGERL